MDKYRGLVVKSVEYSEVDLTNDSCVSDLRSWVGMVPLTKIKHMRGGAGVGKKKIGWVLDTWR